MEILEGQSILGGVKANSNFFFRLCSFICMQWQ